MALVKVNTRGSNIAAGFGNLTTYNATSAGNTIPTGATKLLFMIVGGTGGGASSFNSNGNVGGDSSGTYNSVTYTATAGLPGYAADGGVATSGAAADVAPLHQGGSGTGALVITGGGLPGGFSGQTISNSYACNPDAGTNSGMVIKQVDVVSGQTTYDVVVGTGGTGVTGTYGGDTATGANGLTGYVLVYDNGTG